LEEIKNNGTITLRDGKQIKADDILHEIAKSIYISGDPGLVFVDRLNEDNEDNQVPTAGEYESLAPCGEVGLSPGETCAFSYLNLGEFVKNETINYSDLEKTIIDIVRFLDDVVEYNIERYSNQTSKDITIDKRKIGLGVCGFADLLDKLKLSYNSSEARKIAEDLFSFINYVSKKASIILAQERGSFGKFEESKYLDNDNIIRKYSTKPTNTVSQSQWIELQKDIREKGIRNCATQTV
jgi:ribonucleoside-diphosphate reductase alpha chain